MSHRAAARLAWCLWALTLLLFALAVPLEFLNRGGLLGSDLAPWVFGHAVAWLFWSVLAAVGALVAARRPANPIGWLFCAAWCLIAFGGSGNFAEQYATYGVLTNAGSMPGAWAIAWLGPVARAVGFIPLVTFIPLLFPNGRLPSPTWRPVAYAGLVVLVLSGLANAFQPGLVMDGGIPIPNPLGIEQLAGAFDFGSLIAGLFGLALVFTCVFSVFVRFRGAAADERQQIKWFAYAAGWIVVVAAAGGLMALFRVPWLEPVSYWLYPLSVVPLPIAIGLAILRHRLYDIDLLINRTIVYSALTAGLGLAYWTSVVLLQQVLRPITQGSDLALIGSTATIAGLFNPARRRIQDEVDRRFYRRKYHALRTVESFTAKLRQEVDLESLSAELLAVVSQTVQPQHASLWLRPRPAGPRSADAWRAGAADADGPTTGVR